MQAEDFEKVFKVHGQDQLHICATRTGDGGGSVQVPLRRSARGVLDGVREMSDLGLLRVIAQTTLTPSVVALLTRISCCLDCHHHLTPTSGGSNRARASPVLLVGPPARGKSALCEFIAQLLGCELARINLSGDTTKEDQRRRVCESFRGSPVASRMHSRASVCFCSTRSIWPAPMFLTPSRRCSTRLNSSLRSRTAV
eukprot:Hpha_TRINITY_DN16396_c1_g1::TRINITY_DN16396_c1_g1_i14::g.61069::m.61069